MNSIQVLISIFIQVSDFVKAAKEKNSNLQNFSPNQNYFFDEEVIAIYLFGLHNKIFSNKAIHAFIKEHYLCYFPKLPEYNAFNYRLNRLKDLIIKFPEFLINQVSVTTDLNELVLVVDSMPIVLAKKYKKKEKMFPGGFADNGYCSSKDMYYYGVKLHNIVIAQSDSLALPFFFKVHKASEHDLTAIKSHANELICDTLMGDKAYTSEDFKKSLNKYGTKLVTPIKLSKNKKEYSEDEKYFNKLVSSRRQCVEIFGSWINELTKIQNASKIRSFSGLLFFIFARLSFCLLHLIMFKI